VETPDHVSVGLLNGGRPASLHRRRDRVQASRLSASLEDYIDADNSVRVIEAFLAALDLDALGFAVIPAATGRPGYHPAMLLALNGRRLFVASSFVTRHFARTGAIDIPDC
jgi:hypothetical protein